jgi:hypothetical protein
MVGCPIDGARCHRHSRNGKSDLRMLCTWGSQPDNNRSFALPAGCCAVVRPSATSDLLDAPAGDGSMPIEQFPHKRNCQAHSVDHWLAEQPRAWAWGSPRAHLLEQHGYIVGPIRSLPPAPEQPSQALAALSSLGWSSPSLPGSLLPRLRTVVVLHVRHPLETLVSHYYCVSSARTCPRRVKLAEGGAQGLLAPKFTRHTEVLLLQADSMARRRVGRRLCALWSPFARRLHPDQSRIHRAPQTGTSTDDPRRRRIRTAVRNAPPHPPARGSAGACALQKRSTCAPCAAHPGPALAPRTSRLSTRQRRPSLRRHRGRWRR